MALPSSGQISFNDVRVETSQSLMTDYSMYAWTKGLNHIEGLELPGGTTFAPINILSSGSRWENTNTPSPSIMTYNNLSMSAWYDYNHSLYIDMDVTGSLYNHIVHDNFESKTMLPIKIGTTNKKIKINISGSLLSDTGYVVADAVTIWYGKPWNNDGSYIQSYGDIPDGGAYDTANREYITGSYLSDLLTASIDFSYIFDYTYDSNKGQYLYVVLSYYNSYLP